MKIRHLLLSAVASMLYMSATAQSVPTHEMYVQYATPSNIVKALDEWEPGKQWGEGTDYVDENFFISRVPIKNRFIPGKQANETLNDSNAKNLGWCVPTGEMTKKWGALPRFNFDGDNFSMWQYINIHSNWSNGWWRVPGAFNDVAHKNGVTTGCTYFIDWGAYVNTSENPGKTLYDLSAPLSKANEHGDKYKYSRKLIQFLKYYGIDGLCLNPEGTWVPALYNRFIPFLAECHKIAEELGHPFHVDWYAYVSNTGQLSDNGCKLNSSNQNWFHHKATDQPVTDMFFLNYNWSDAGLAESVNTAKALGRSTFDVYAGFDQQGRGYGKYGNAGWEVLMKHPVSIVVWGAHDRSQLYTASTEGGQSDYAVQNEYVKKQELLFSGANRNVLNLPEINTGNTTASYNDLASWHGYAKAVREQSTLYELPFVTRFNLGNGRFMNNEGITTWNHKWYNIGMQDLLPTWRWWIDNGDGKTVPADAIKMDFTFDDAWFAGSCLKVHGATTRSDVRLFATQWNVVSGDDEFRITYKPNTASAQHLNLMVAKKGDSNSFKLTALPSEMKAGAWNSIVIKASEAGLTAGDVIECVGLSVQGTQETYEALLGEFAFVPASFNEQPSTPTITHSEVMKRFYNRADIKVVFEMPTPSVRKPEYEGCPVYNEEVGTWYYEIWVKQGDSETLVTTTTSWAAYAVDAPLTPGIDKLQIGVRAVGKDGRAKSRIVWTEEIEEPLTMIETLTLSKDIIKPGEDFTIGFEDPNHPVADIYIYNAYTGKEVTNQKDALTLTTSLPEVGSYDVKVVSNGVELMNRSLILVSPEETGRLPQINSITSDVTEVTGPDQQVSFTADINKGTEYNGAPCTVSQALYMSEPYQLTVDATVMTEYTNTSFALWFKVEKFEHASLGTLLMTKVNRNYGGTWTESVWGEMWTAIRPEGYAAKNNIGRDNAPNELSVSFDGPIAGTPNYEHNNDVDGLTDGYTLQPGTWYHVCVVKSGRNAKLYLNGKKVIDCQSRGAGPKNWRGAHFYVGGSMTNLASFTGWVDEVQIWSKSLSDAEVLESMKGFKTAPEGLQGYFTFESTETDDNGYIYFPNSGKNSSKVKGAYMTTGKDENGKNVDYKQNQLTTALGVPMLQGSNTINYESSRWMLDGAHLNSSTDLTANATYNSGDGKFPITLTANNSWGSTTKTITDYIVVTAIDDVNSDAGYMIYPKPFEGTADVMFAENGIYDVAVFSADGKQVAKDVFEARAGELRTISIADLDAGVYVVAIIKDGKAVRSFKIKK